MSTTPPRSRRHLSNMPVLTMPLRIDADVWRDASLHDLTYFHKFGHTITDVELVGLRDDTVAIIFGHLPNLQSVTLNGVHMLHRATFTYLPMHLHRLELIDTVIAPTILWPWMGELESRLTDLAITDSSDCAMPSCDYDPMFQLRALKRCTLKFVNDNRMRTTVLINGSCLTLKSFALHRFGTDSLTDIEMLRTIQCVNLTELSLDNVTVASLSIFDWHLHIYWPNLTRLTVTGIECAAVDYVLSMLGCADTLESLTIDVGQHQLVADDSIDITELMRFKNLRHLTLANMMWQSLGESDYTTVSQLLNANLPLLETLELPYAHFIGARITCLLAKHMPRLRTVNAPHARFSAAADVAQVAQPWGHDCFRSTTTAKRFGQLASQFDSELSFADKQWLQEHERAIPGPNQFGLCMEFALKLRNVKFDISFDLSELCVAELDTI